MNGLLQKEAKVREEAGVAVACQSEKRKEIKKAKGYVLYDNVAFPFSLTLSTKYNM